MVQFSKHPDKIATALSFAVFDDEVTRFDCEVFFTELDLKPEVIKDLVETIASMRWVEGRAESMYDAVFEGFADTFPQYKEQVRDWLTAPSAKFKTADPTARNYRVRR